MGKRHRVAISGAALCYVEFVLAWADFMMCLQQQP